MQRKEVIAAAFLFVLIFCGGVFAENGLGLGAVVLKTTIKTGEFDSKSLNVQGNTDGDFTIRVNAIEGVSVSDESFFLRASEGRNIDVFFNASGLAPGIYVGNFEINGPNDALVVPVIFEVESDDVFFDANVDIPPAYAEITPGEKLISQVKVFDLTSGGGIKEGLGPVSVTIDYSVFGTNGGVIVSRSEQVIVDRQTQLTNPITFPSEIPAGTYILGAVVKHGSSIGVSSQTFAIVQATAVEEAQLFGLANLSWVVIAAIGAFLFLVIVFMFVYLLRDRDKIFVELRKYNEQEMRRVRALLREQEQLLRQKKVAAAPSSSENLRNELRREFADKIARLKRKQAARVHVIRKLKESGDVQEMERKLKEWKSQYREQPMQYKVKQLSAGDMERVLKKWKKSYGGKKTHRKQSGN